MLQTLKSTIIIRNQVKEMTINHLKIQSCIEFIFLQFLKNRQRFFIFIGNMYCLSGEN